MDISAPQPFVALTLRSLQNSRGDFLLTTMPIADLRQTPTTSPLVFPQIADSGGYQTQIILLSTAGSSTVTVDYFGNDGAPVIVEGAEPPNPDLLEQLLKKRRGETFQLAALVGSR